jgi:hypothetical protein
MASSKGALSGVLLLSTRGVKGPPLSAQLRSELAVLQKLGQKLLMDFEVVESPDHGLAGGSRMLLKLAALPYLRFLAHFRYVVLLIEEHTLRASSVWNFR